jgi:hypothetical protein
MENITLVNATTDFLKSEILKKDERIAELQDAYQRYVTRDSSLSANINNIRNEMQEWTLEQVEEGGLTNMQAESIADICGFELVKEVDAIVTVEYSVTLQVPAGMDAEDMINDIDFDTVSYNDDHITGLYSSVTSIDI